MKKLFCLLICLLMAFVFLKPSINVYADEESINDSLNITAVVGSEKTASTIEISSINTLTNINALDVSKPLLEILNIDTKSENITYSYLANTLGNNQFILFEGDNSYFIYDTLAEKIIEYSTATRSAWNNEMGYKIYGGPMNYFSYSNNSLTNLVNNDVTEHELNLTFDVETTQINTAKAKIFLNNTSQPLTQENVSLNEGIEVASVTPPSSNLPFFDGYFIEETHVPYSFYFRNMVYTDSPNQYASCGYVALTLLLSYYDTFYNKNIIPDKNNEVNVTNDDPGDDNPNDNPGDDNPNDNPEDSNPQDNYDYPDGNQQKTINPEEITVYPSQNLHNYMLVINEDDPAHKSNGTLAYDLLKAINTYFARTNCTVSNLVDAEAGLFSSRSTRIREGTPIIMGLLTNYRTDGINTKPTEPGKHYVVVYGIRRTAKQTFYNAHMGWEGKVSDVWIDAGIFGDYVYLNCDGLENNHVCDNRYVNEHTDADGNTCLINLCPVCVDYEDKIAFVSYTESGGHTFKCKECNTVLDEKIINHSYTKFYLGNESPATMHVAECIYCGDIYSPEEGASTTEDIRYHRPVFAASISSQKHKIVCGDCGYTMAEYDHDIQTTAAYPLWCFRTGCQVCEYTTSTIAHLFDEYAAGSSSTHKNFCRLCGIENTSHDIVSVETGATTHNATCSCGYVITNEAHVIGTTPRRHYCEICDYSGEHTLSSYSGITAVTHSRTCSTCNEVIVAEHLFLYMYDSSGHYQACSCGYSTIVENHVYSNYVNNGLNHIATCVCGHQITELHLWTNNIFGGQICHICGATSGMLHPFNL